MMSDFLSFEHLISLKALIAFYYLGALVLPVAIWAFISWIRKKVPLFGAAMNAGTSLVGTTLSTKQKVYFSTLFVVSFMMAELFWRILFEFLIAFIQMRNALMLLAS